MLTNAPRGTKDMLPAEAHKWHFIEDAFKRICSRHGFTEMRTPVFEHTELFTRGVGDTTDIVQKEMYTWNQADRSLTLRPEGTSPVVRAFVEHKLYAEPQPSKYSYDIACFRYEKPQSGRLRQFHQFGIEIFGTNNMMADSEVIGLAHDFIQELGITDVELQINSIGCPACRETYRKALKAFLEPVKDELCDTCQDRYERNPMRILDCKSPVDQKLVEGAPRMLDYLCEECQEAFDALQGNLTAMDIPYVVNPGIVRGLDYYTKTAFEFVTQKIGAQGTVCGGGRYDHLSEELGGPPIPGVGFGMGKERLLLMMDACGVHIPEPPGPDAFIAFAGEEARRKGLELMRTLRGRGYRVEMDCMARNLKGQFKYADRLNVRKTIILGEDELKAGTATIRDMAESEQRAVPFDRIEEALIETNE